MAPSQPIVITYAFKIVKDTEFNFSRTILDATISLREGTASMIFISDDAEQVPSLAQLRAEAVELGVPVITTEDAKSLGEAFGMESATVISLNGGEEHLKEAVKKINEAIALENISPAA